MMSVKHRITGCVAVGLMFVSLLSQARVYSPRVVSEHNADSYSIKTFAQDSRFRNLQGDQKAWAMYSYLTDYDTGLYPMGIGAFEGSESLYEYSLVRDPVKLINVYSIGYCDVFGPVMAGIWEDAGLGTARVVDLPWFDHVAAEVFYDGLWHYLDLDLRSAFRDNNGFLASLADARTDPALWNQPNAPRFFPLDDIAQMQQSYTNSDVINRYGVHQSGHTMDFVLRQGESFTRWWQPQGGRWLHHPNFNTEPFVNDLIERAPRGPKAKHESYTRHSHGNGRFIYTPDLSDQSTDFIDGVYDSQNITRTQSGLTLEQSGSGYAVFEVRTPYVIVPLVGNTASTADDREASVVSIDATAASYSISLDNGITWEAVAASGADIDLTRQTSGKYGYLFRIELNGEPGQTVVRSMTMDTWVQLAPAALPSLRSGSNRMEFRKGDHHGLNTRVVEIAPDTADQGDFYKHLVVEPDDYFPESLTSRIRSPFVMAVQAPPGAKIAWFSAGGSFETYQLESAALTEFSMEYAVDLPFSYNNFYTASLPQDMEHWYTNAQQEVILQQPAESVYLRYEGVPAVNTVQVYAHLIDEDQRDGSPVEITHRWYDGDTLKSYSTTSENGVYFIDAGTDPVDESIELSVASQYVAPESTPRPEVSDVTANQNNPGPVQVGTGQVGIEGLLRLLLLLMLSGLMSRRTPGT